MADKLHIPGPDEQEDLTELDMTIFVGWAICMIICIGLFLFFRDRRPQPEPPKPEDPVKARQAELVDRAHKQNFDKHEFSDKDAVAVFRHGPRDAAEAACKDVAPLLESGGLSHTVHLELLKTVDRRAEHAPWTCLTRAFLANKISSDLDLEDELSEFWQETEAFETSPALVSSVLEEFRRSRNRPESKDFYAWLRLCGLHPDYEANKACLKILYQISPAQGEDALAAVEEHFAERDSERLRDDMKVLIPALGELAQKGQPDEWRVENKAIDDFETVFRVGATFVLCRIVHSPDDPVARQAAVEVAETATVGARASDENLLSRWRESCGLAFRAGEGEQADSAPALAVWNGEEGEPPDYTLAWAQDRGDCPQSEDRPAWYCGAKLWQGGEQELDLALMHYFTETRYIEWAGE